jgi:uncharacterized membrane protein YtjA (UPF0391 family)
LLHGLQSKETANAAIGRGGFAASDARLATHLFMSFMIFMVRLLGGQQE